MIARLTLWDTIGAFLTRSQPKAPGAAPGLSFTLCVSADRTGRQAPALVKWSRQPFWGCRRCDKSRPVATHRRVGALTYSSNRVSKWHSSGPRRRAQSRSQKARWKERKRQQRRKRAKRSPDSAIGVVKIGASVAVTSVPYFASRAAAMRRRRNQNTLAHTGERTRRWRQRYRGRQAAIVPMSKSRSICRVHGWKDRPTLPTDRCWLTGTLHGAARWRAERPAKKTPRIGPGFEALGVVQTTTVAASQLSATVLMTHKGRPGSKAERPVR